MADHMLDCVPVCPDNPSIEKDEALCVKCGHWAAVCKEEIGVAELCSSAAPMVFPCIYCGQCAAVCPEGAIRVKSQIEAVARARRLFTRSG